MLQAGVRQTGGQPMSLCLEDGLSKSMILLHVAMSLDGFIAGPGHDMSWTGGAEYDTSSELANEVARATGVVLAGRGWYEVASEDEGGAVAGIYGGAWSGPVLVLTHHPERLASDPTVDAVSDLESGLARAEELADGRAVSIFGANVARQVLALGRLDEIIVQIVPLVLGDGVRLFGEAPGPRVRLERTYVGTSGTLTDVRFRVAGPQTSEFGLDAIDENRL
jgi:dihydrofolate reductase